MSKNAPTHLVVAHAVIVRLAGRMMTIRGAKVRVALDVIFWGASKQMTIMCCIADVNECLKNNGGCDSKRTCTNIPGGRTCGDCPSGWTNDGDTECRGLQ